MASRKSTPMFRSVSWIEVRIPKISTSGPKGSTATGSRASATARNGASTYRNLLACGGIRSSLVSSLMTSAKRLQQPVRSHARRAHAQLDVGDHLALHPLQVGQRGQNDRGPHRRLQQS